MDPVPLPIRWTVADSALSDDAANIFRSADETPGLDGTLGEEVAVFARIPSRRLVVIGQPGAGKTVFTIRLTLNLVAGRQPGGPVPVIFGLHTWNPLEQSLQEWLATRLAVDYPSLRNTSASGRTMAEDLISNGLIIPVLDGLDEIGDKLRGQALITLNACLREDTPVIMTCRDEDYAQIVDDADVLTAAAVVRLLPLELADLAGYLPRTTKKIPSSTAPGLAGKWDPVLQRLADQPDAPAARALLSVLRTPLMTSLARSIYSDTPADPARLLGGDFTSREHIEAHLLDEFIPAVFTTTPTSRPGSLRRHHPEDAERWLRFLARHLSRLGTRDLNLARDLQWWRLSDALPAPVRWVAPGLLIMAGFTVGAAVARSLLALGVGVSIAVGLMAGLSIVTARLPALGQEKAGNRLRVMGHRLGYASLAALPAGFALAFILTQDPGALIGSGFRRDVSECSAFLLVGLAVGVILGAAGIDAEQAPTTTPLRLRRRARLLSRRLQRDAGYGLLTGLAVSLALWIAWCIGFAAATEVRVATAPAFPAGGSMHRLAGGTVYTDYPGGIRLTLAAGGDRYVLERQASDQGDSYGSGFAGTLHGRFTTGSWSGPAQSDCSYSDCYGSFTYNSTIGLIRVNSYGNVNSADGNFLPYRSPLPLTTAIAWAYHPSFSAALSEVVAESPLEALIIGLAGSVIGAIFLWLGFPAEAAQAVSPLSTLRTDRTAAISRAVAILPFLGIGIVFVAYSIAYIIHSQIPFYFAAQFGPNRTYNYALTGYDLEKKFFLAVVILFIGLILGIVLGLISLTLSSWGRFQVARTWLAARGRLPWRLMRFLEDAHACGALRQAGASYQFRHVRLQERLASRPEP